MATLMLSARIDTQKKKDAEVILNRYGRTFSTLIRDLVDTIVETGELPEFEMRAIRESKEAGKRELIARIEKFAERPMPPRLDDRPDEVLYDEVVMERYGN